MQKDPYLATKDIEVRKRLVIEDLQNKLTTDNLSCNLYTSLGGNCNRVRQCFGTWPNALAASFSEERILAWNKLKRKITSEATKRYFDYSEEKLMALFVKAYKVIKSKYGYFDFKLYLSYKPEWAPSHSTFQRKYGSVKAFYKKVKNLYPEEIGFDLIHPYDENDYRDSLMKIYNKYGAVSHHLILEERRRNKRGCIGCDAILKRYGSLKNACEHFGIPYTDKIHKSKLSIAVETEANRLLNLKGVTEKTWPWLKYKAHLYVDLYYEELNAAIEIHGDQHYKRVEWFQRTDEDFQIGLKRDIIKKELLEQHGIDIFYVNKNTLKQLPNILSPLITKQNLMLRAAI